MAKRNRPSSPLHPLYWPTWLGIALSWLVGQLPFRFLLWLGKGLGHVLWHVAKSRRHTALTNIRLCFPELSAEQQHQLAKASVVSVGQAMLEITASYNNNRLKLKPRVNFVGLENLHAAQATGQGILLIGMHFNMLDMAGRLMALAAPYSAVYRPNDNPVLDRQIKRGRSKYTEHYIDKSDFRGMVKVLKTGGILWYAPDQDYGRKHAVFAPFFNHPAATVTGTSYLAAAGKALVVPMAYYREPGGKYTVEFGKALEHFPSKDMLADATLINATIEHYVRKRPEQYLWVHRRFKHQPDPSDNPYRKSK